jgi:hypothetical protein
LGFADPAQDGFVGFERLSLFGGAEDLVDRLKLRLTVSLAGFGEQEVTEETLAVFGFDVGALSPDPVILGPVRVVLDAAGTGMAYRDRVSFELSLFEGLTLPAGFTFQAGRVSLDLSEAALGAAYRDANMSAEVPVDGMQDGVPERPLPDWRDLQLADGRLVILRRKSSDAVTASTYYKDDARVDGGDTGDGKSFGDQGVRADNLTDLVHAGFPGEMVVLRNDGAFSAATLAENLAHPMTFEITVGRLPHTPTPGPTGATTATPTASPSRLPTATVTSGTGPTPALSETPTARPKVAAIFLPFCHRPR